MQRCIYLAMGKLHVLCFRTLLKRVHQCQLELGGHATQLRLDAVTDCCARLGMAVDAVEVRLCLCPLPGLTALCVCES